MGGRCERTENAIDFIRSLKRNANNPVNKELAPRRKDTAVSVLVTVSVPRIGTLKMVQSTAMRTPD